MPFWGWALIGGVVVLLLGWYLTYTAARLDRLHARVEGSLSSLDAQLVRRAEVSLEIGGSGSLDAASAFLLLSTASASLEMAESVEITAEVQERGLPQARVDVEDELTGALSAVVQEWVPDSVGEQELRRRLADACARVELAQRFHRDAVRDVRRMRSQTLVRLGHLAGHAAFPDFVEFDDHVAGLETFASSWS